jgi:hypothetical protein
VTKSLSDNLGPVDVTLKLLDNSAKRYARLKPWLDLGNIALPVLESEEARGGGEGKWQAHKSKTNLPAFLDKIRKGLRANDGMSERIRLGNQTLKQLAVVLTHTNETVDFPAGTLRKWSANPGINGSTQLLKLATRVAEAFKFCTLKHMIPDQATLDQGRDVSYREDCITQTAPEARVVLDRRQERLAIQSFDPYRDYFLPAIQGLEIERIRRCPVCGQFFFALRWDRDGKYGTKACSKKCNQVRRMRDWRASQSAYEQNRKFKLAGVRPEEK